MQYYILPPYPLPHSIQVKKPMYNSSMTCESIMLDMDGLDKMSNNDEIGQNAPISNCNEPDVFKTEDYNNVTSLFLALYLLIGNVMLLNLLIAIFT